MARRVALVILDGWGESTLTEHNAIAQAHTPNWDWLKQNATCSTLIASGTAVGLPKKQMGNSEVGHMHIGAGRIINQDLTQISKACETTALAEILENNKTLQALKHSGKSLHLLGLLSEGGVHSHQEHLFALLKNLKAMGITNIFIHAILDGRDTPPKSALSSVQQLNSCIKTLGVGKVASICGRFYAMDRDNRWERIEKAYRCLCDEDKTPLSAVEALTQAYNQELTDEFVRPTPLKDHHPIQKGEALLCFNFRADRMRELTHALSEKRFNEFKRATTPTPSLITLTEYHPDLKADVLFPPQEIKNTLGEVISHNKLSQFRIAETEKYAHVTFFFNGGRDAPFPLEQRVLIPSPKVKTYDLKPEMSANEVAKQLSEAINEEKYAFLLCNFANADMVGHTGDFKATLKAIETVDECLGHILKACQEHQTDLLITADHGNAETMFNPNTNQAHTAHTENPVPFIHLGAPSTLANFTPSLQDITPTVLALLGLAKPIEMTGQSILNV